MYFISIPYGFILHDSVVLSAISNFVFETKTIILGSLTYCTVEDTNSCTNNQKLHQCHHASHISTDKESTETTLLPEETYCKATFQCQVVGNLYPGWINTWPGSCTAKENYNIISSNDKFVKVWKIYKHQIRIYNIIHRDIFQKCSSYTISALC